MRILLSISLAAVLLSACGSKTNKTDSATNSSEINATSAQPLTNPKHGMPGHDCAVPEGAPLPQKGLAQPSVEATAPAAVQTEVQNSPVETNKAIKLNPAHGMPGHRCEIAVGAPLS